MVSWSTTVMIEMRLLWLRLLIFSLIAFRVSSLFLLHLRGCSYNRFAFVLIVLTSYHSFSFIFLKIFIISRWDKNSLTRGGNMRRVREFIPQANSVRSWFLEVQHFIQLCIGSPLQLSLNLEQFCFKLLGSFSQEVVLKPQCSNGLIGFINLCG